MSDGLGAIDVATNQTAMILRLLTLLLILSVENIASPASLPSLHSCTAPRSKYANEPDILSGSPSSGSDFDRACCPSARASTLLRLRGGRMEFMDANEPDYVEVETLTMSKWRPFHLQ